jgi:pSer/pThr/pTyr-binding forkhead associated (FHA) protein
MTIRLRIVQGRPQGKHLSFDHGEYVFGRGEECHVRPNSEWVSRQHCLLRVTRNAASIRDLASGSGTLVNGIRITQEQVLAQGDRVEVGPLMFEVDLDLPPCI